MGVDCNKHGCLFVQLHLLVSCCQVQFSEVSSPCQVGHEVGWFGKWVLGDIEVRVNSEIIVTSDSDRLITLGDRYYRSCPVRVVDPSKYSCHFQSVVAGHRA